MSWAWQRLRSLGQMQSSAQSIQQRQATWLMECLVENQSTSYGKRYGFGAIRSVKEFQERVPLTDYEVLATDFEGIANGAVDVLFGGSPIAFERTGGSTSGCKLIPYSERSLRDFRVALLPWLAEAIERHAIESGSAYWAISPATRAYELTPSGIPIGLPDGAYLGMDALSAFAEITVTPAWVGELTNVAEWQIATLYCLLCRDDLVLISVWSPSFFLVLLDALDQRSDALVEILAKGRSIGGHELSPDKLALERYRQYLSNRQATTLWPNLKLVSCWADASSKPYYEQLRQRLPQAEFQAKGLLSCESVVTVPQASGPSRLALDSGFFEFLDDSGHAKLAHELLPERDYEVVITTSGGLYRYRTGDCLRCIGLSELGPELKFMGRKGLVSDMVGEKLNDEFVLSCMAGVAGFRLLIPVLADQPYYTLVLDEEMKQDAQALVQELETGLMRNPQYAYARRIGQLAPLSVMQASKPLDAYIQRCMNKGARMGDVKLTALRPETDWLDTFARSAR